MNADDEHNRPRVALQYLARVCGTDCDSILEMLSQTGLEGERSADGILHFDRADALAALASWKPAADGAEPGAGTADKADGADTARFIDDEGHEWLAVCHAEPVRAAIDIPPPKMGAKP